MSEETVVPVKKNCSKKTWIKKELEGPLEPKGDWIVIPKFLVFENEPRRTEQILRTSASPEQEQVGRNTEIVTFCVSYSPSANSLLYGVSVKAPQDQQWLSYGKAVAKSRLRSLLNNKYSFSDLAPVQKYCSVFSNSSMTQDEISECVKNMAKEVHSHFLNRVVQGDMIDKFPKKVRNSLVSGCFRLIAPSVI